MHQHHHEPTASDQSVVVDCARCTVRSAAACGDCVVTFLLGGPPEELRLEADEQVALDVLADAGVVPPLRLVTPVEAPDLPDIG